MSGRIKTTELSTVEHAAPNPVVAGIETATASLQDGFEKVTAGFQQTQAKFQESVEKAVKTAEEFVVFGQGNLDAFLKSGQIWATGVQELGKHVAAAAQASVEDAVSSFKALGATKSLKDAIDLQTSLARTTLEKTLAESGKLADASFKLTEQTLAPITARVTLAVEKFAKPA